MGLDISHDTWHGSYFAFNRWRTEIAKVAGLPPLGIMEGFYAKGDIHDPMTMVNILFPNQDDSNVWQLRRIFDELPIKWECLKPSALHELLNHSDCDGEISYESAANIADELELLLPKLNGNGGGHIGDLRQKTETFIRGLRLAHSKKENLEFR